MPCYLFTYHGHGTWMPDHRSGYVRRKAGVVTADQRMALCYRKNMKQKTVAFDGMLQKHLIEGIRTACQFLEVRCHGIATERSHVHLLISWTSARTWQSIHQALKTSLTRRLNGQVRRQKWFSKGGSRKRIEDREHFEYLQNVYLPGHSGLLWTES